MASWAQGGSILRSPENILDELLRDAEEVQQYDHDEDPPERTDHDHD